jgi:hypothetical protein
VGRICSLTHRSPMKALLLVALFQTSAVSCFPGAEAYRITERDEVLTTTIPGASIQALGSGSWYVVFDLSVAQLLAGGLASVGEPDNPLQMNTIRFYDPGMVEWISEVVAHSQLPSTTTVPSAILTPDGVLHDLILEDISPPPIVTISSQGLDVRISWPTAFGQYTLESANALTPETWKQERAPVLTNGQAITVTLPATNGQMYYRLAQKR